MMRAVGFGVAALSFLVVSSAANASHTHHGYHGHHKHRHAANIRYGGAPGRGYWRPGPQSGYGFRFATYKGDPFGRDDYFDGGNCYYRKHHNYCVPSQIFTGFRHPE